MRTSSPLKVSHEPVKSIIKSYYFKLDINNVGVCTLLMGKLKFAADQRYEMFQKNKHTTTQKLRVNILTTINNFKYTPLSSMIQLKTWQL